MNDPLSEIGSSEITQKCPRFKNCSAPICPLDPLQDNRTYLEGEDRCQLPKSRRLRIADGTSLPKQGMTNREWAGKQSWDQLSEAEQERKNANLARFAFRSKRDSEQSSDSQGATLKNPHSACKGAQID